MPLDIEVQGDPASLRASAAWLRRLSEATHDAGTSARGAVSASESAWTGTAGDAFRARIGTAVTETDGMSRNNADAATALERHADDLDTVKARMNQAKGIALTAGLKADDKRICEPVGPPPAVKNLPTDRPPTEAEAREFSAAQSAMDDWNAQKKAFDECVRTVAEADRLEKDSQSALGGFFSGLADVATHPAALLSLDAVASATGAHIAARVPWLREAADQYTHAASAARGMAARVTAAGGDRVPAWDFVRQAALAEREKAKLTAEATRLVGRYGYPATFMQNVRSLTAMTVGNPNVPGLSRGATVLRSVPVVGVGLTAAGVIIDVIKKPTWENAVISTTAGGASLLASTAVGAAFAPLMLTGPAVLVPVGLGIATGVVVNWAVKKYGDDAINLAKDAGGEIKDVAKDVGKGAKNAGKGIVKGVKSLF